jgi:hypothetical protein
MGQVKSDELIYEQRISALRKGISLLVEWVVFGVLLVIFYVVALNAQSDQNDEWLNLIWQILGSFVFTLLLFLVIFTIDVVKDLRYLAWSDFRLQCLINLEVFPDVEGSVAERVLNKIKEIYPTVNGFPPGKGVRLNDRATWLTTDRWDIVVNLNALKAVDTANLVLVRIMGPEEVSVKELKALGRAVLKLRLLKPISDVQAVFVVSPGGYSSAAMDATMRGKIKGLPRLGTRLVLVKDKGFKLES